MTLVKFPFYYIRSKVIDSENIKKQVIGTGQIYNERTKTQTTVFVTQLKNV